MYMEPWTVAKNVMLVWWCHQFLSGFLAKGHSLQISHLLANDTDDNEIPRAVHRSPGIYLMAEENPTKLSYETDCVGSVTNYCLK